MSDLDVARVEAFMRGHVPDFAGPLSVQRFAEGQSNPTYLLSTPQQQYVLRRKPGGPLLGSAHAVDREYAILAALAQHTELPVPRPFALCSDDAAIGSSFYVMEYVRGEVLSDAALPEVPEALRAAYYMGLVQTLAKLHCLDYQAVGLGSLRRSGAYCARQIKRWAVQYTQDSAAGRVPAMERLLEWLGSNVPEEGAQALIHGDYRWGNVMFEFGKPRIAAVLDWELATIGDPLADFAHLLMCYRIPSLGVSGLQGRDVPALGLPTEDDVVRLYCECTSRRDIRDLEYYLAFSMFRLAAIFHGIRGRMLRGTASSGFARQYAAHVETLAELAWSQVQRH